MADSNAGPLDAGRWKKIEAIFFEASELDAGSLTAYLDKACADDSDLRTAVEKMLEADSAASAFLGRAAAEGVGALIGTQTATGDASSSRSDAASGGWALEPGALVGRYKVINLIGRGGMGSVYRAERADGAYERQVALKIVRTERLGDEAEMRFRQERQILARLQHPGIATLLDGAVTDEGRPFLVMELIDGASLTQYAERARLNVRERLRLFQQVIDAVDYAHRNLVVHRDLKPSNILVTESGDVKLLDFGIARLIAEDADERVTRTGMYLFTPEYAAPEQIRGEAVSTATDVYALGAVLYELLTGQSPFGSVGRRWTDLERVLGDEPRAISRVDGLDVQTRRSLEGDLTTIVARAMRKDPARRYASARELGDDIDRHLEGRPVTARPDSIGYRISKFVGRNKVASALGFVAAVAVVVGIATTAWQYRSARGEAQRAQAVGDFLYGLFDGVDPDLHPGEPVTAFELLEAGVARVDQFDAGPEARVDLLTRLGILFGKLGHEERSVELLRKAVVEATRDLPADDPLAGTALDALGVRLALTGGLEEAEEVLRRALDIRMSNGASDIGVGSTQGNLAKALERRGRYDEAIEVYRSAIATLDRATEGDSLVFATELMGLAQAYQFAERFGEADTLMRAVRRLREREGDTRAHAIAIHNLAQLTAAWKDDIDAAVALHEESLAMWRRIFPGGQHPEISHSLEQIARLRELQGDWEVADSLYNEALGLWTDLYGDEHPHLAAIRANQANLHYRRGDYGSAAEAYVDIVRVYRAVGDPRFLSVSIHNLGVIHREMGAYDEAEARVAEALEIRRGYLEEPHSDIAQSLSTQAGLYNLLGRHAEAEQKARGAITQYEAVLPAEHSLIRWPRLELGIAMVAQGRDAEARPFLEAVHERFVEALNPDDVWLGRVGVWLAIVERRAGARDRARDLLEASLQALKASARPDAPDRLLAERELAALR